MTRANMRAIGVRSLWVVCANCRHRAVLNVDTYNEAVTVPSFGPKMVCTLLRHLGADVQPNWRERSQTESLTRRHWN